jgi:hypothetical protein
MSAAQPPNSSDSSVGSSAAVRLKHSSFSLSSRNAFKSTDESPTEMAGAARALAVFFDIFRAAMKRAASSRKACALQNLILRLGLALNYQTLINRSENDSIDRLSISDGLQRI